MGLMLSILMLGATASLSPTTILVFIVILGTTRAKVNAAAFLIGWTASAAMVFTVSYFVGSSAFTQHGPPRIALLVVEVLLGCLLIFLGVRRWRHRASYSASSDDPTLRMLADRVEDMRPTAAALVGVLKQPWAITTAAAAVVVHHHTARPVAAIALALFIIASTASVGLMYIDYVRRPHEATLRLAHVREHVTTAGPAVFAAGAGAVGVFLLIDGLVGLLSM